MLFDLGWSELLVIAVVLVVVVGPKDLPGMLRTFGRVSKQLRSMAGDFRRQFDDALKEAELDDVRKGIDDVRALDPRGAIRDAMSPMKAIGDEIRSSLNSATPSPEPRVPSPDDKPVPEGVPAKTGAVTPGPDHPASEEAHRDKAAAKPGAPAETSPRHDEPTTAGAAHDADRQTADNQTADKAKDIA